MNHAQPVLAAISALLLVFLGVGVLLLVQSLRPRGSSGGFTVMLRELRAASRGYFGPPAPELALLSPLARVGLELVAALCGFPGFGWLFSSRMRIGVPLLIIGPSITFGFYPALLVLSGRVAASPLEPLKFLPVVAVASATALAIAEVRRARAVHQGH